VKNLYLSVALPQLITRIFTVPPSSSSMNPVYARVHVGFIVIPAL
jgi:hypothetical protein